MKYVLHINIITKKYNIQLFFVLTIDLMWKTDKICKTLNFIKTMETFIDFIIILFWLFCIYIVLIVSLLKLQLNKIEEIEEQIIDQFFAKINKIPALVEIMKKYIKKDDIYEDIIYLHKLWIIYNVDGIYSILNLNFRTYKELQFLIKLSQRIPEITKNWNFLYIKNYISFHEKDIEKEIWIINIEFAKYNKLITLKNLSVIWLLYPLEKRILI